MTSVNVCAIAGWSTPVCAFVCLLQSFAHEEFVAILFIWKAEKKEKENQPKNNCKSNYSQTIGWLYVWLYICTFNIQEYKCFFFDLVSYANEIVMKCVTCRCVTECVSVCVCDCQQQQLQQKSRAIK